MSKNCATLYCINDAQHGRFCFKCRQRMYRAKNKIANAYQALKDSARRRFIDFSITKEYWKEFCERTKYHELKGTGPDDMSIDRPNSLRGYADDNISMKTVRDNTLKQHGEDKQQRMEALSSKYKSEGSPF